MRGQQPEVSISSSDVNDVYADAEQMVAQQSQNTGFKRQRKQKQGTTRTPQYEDVRALDNFPRKIVPTKAAVPKQARSLLVPTQATKEAVPSFCAIVLHLGEIEETIFGLDYVSRLVANWHGMQLAKKSKKNKEQNKAERRYKHFTKVLIHAAADMIIVNYRNKYDELRERYDELKDNYEELKERYEELKDKYDEVKERYDELKDKYDELEDKLDKLKDKNDEVKDNLDKLEGKYNEVKDKLVKLKDSPFEFRDAVDKELTSTLSGYGEKLTSVQIARRNATKTLQCLLNWSKEVGPVALAMLLVSKLFVPCQMTTMLWTDTCIDLGYFTPGELQNVAAELEQGSCQDEYEPLHPYYLLLTLFKKFPLIKYARGSLNRTAGRLTLKRREHVVNHFQQPLPYEVVELYTDSQREDSELEQLHCEAQSVINKKRGDPFPEGRRPFKACEDHLAKVTEFLVCTHTMCVWLQR